MCLDRDDCNRATRRAVIGRIAFAAAATTAARAAAPVPVPKRGRLTVRRDGAAIDAHFSLPLGGRPTGLVVVLHGNAALPADVIETADWAAERGFAGLAVSSTSREPDVSLIDRAFLRSAAFGERYIADAREAVRVLREDNRLVGNPLAVFGYCGGGHTALQWGSMHPGEISAFVGAHVAFRNGRGGGEFTRPEGIDLYRPFGAPTQLHFGTADHYTPAEDIERVRAVARSSGKPLEIFMYEDARHGFPMFTNSTYVPAHARRLRARAAVFLHRHLRQGSQV